MSARLVLTSAHCCAQADCRSSFLRGCGLTDRFIEYLPSLSDAPATPFYSVFISFSTKDQDFANRLHADLQANGIRCWFAPDDMRRGEKLHDQIDRAIHLSERLLLILSADSMRSPWVKVEIGKARQKEVTLKRRVLFPITLVPFADIRAWDDFNADLGENSAREIREYFIPDFSQWQTHQHYRLAFKRLLKDLKAGS